MQSGLALHQYSQLQYLSAEEEEGKLFAQANIEKTETGEIAADKIIARSEADYPVVDKTEVDYTDVAPNQIAAISPVSVFSMLACANSLPSSSSADKY